MCPLCMSVSVSESVSACVSAHLRKHKLRLRIAARGRLSVERDRLRRVARHKLPMNVVVGRTLAKAQQVGQAPLISRRCQTIQQWA
jgi:hypothetical protein